MYHLVHNKSKEKPFSVANTGKNGEVLSEHRLKTKQACFRNLKAVLTGVLSVGGADVYIFVQDETKKPFVVYSISYKNGVNKVDGTPTPAYIPGRNPKKKSAKKK